MAIIAPVLPNNSREIERVDDRRVINGILWRFRTGSSLQDVPEPYGPRTTLYNRFSRWRKAGVWDRLQDVVSKRYDGDLLMIDISRARSPAWCQREKGGSADLCMGRSRGGLTTKIHALVDADGRPVRLELTAGQSADAPMAEKLLNDPRPGATILADKAYDTDAIHNFAKQRQCWPIFLQRYQFNRVSFWEMLRVEVRDDGSNAW